MRIGACSLASTEALRLGACEVDQAMLGACPVVTPGQGALSVDPAVCVDLSQGSTDNNGASGLVVFSRASVATHVNPDGSVVEVPVDEARFHGMTRVSPGVYTPVTEDCGWLRELPATNLITNPKDYSQANWDLSNVTTFDNMAHPAPDGSNDATLIESDPTKSSGSLYTEFTVTPGVTYTFAQWVKLITGTDSGVGIYDVTNAAWVTGGVNSLWSEFGVILTTDWQRVEVSFTIPAGCTTLRIYAFRSRSAIPASQGSVHIWASQAETGLRATSFIDGTRATEYLRYTDVFDTEGDLTVKVEYTPPLDGADLAQLRLWGEDADPANAETRVQRQAAAYFVYAEGGARIGLADSDFVKDARGSHVYTVENLGGTDSEGKQYKDGALVRQGTSSVAEVARPNPTIWRLSRWDTGQGTPGVYHAFQVFGGAITEDEALWLSEQGNLAVCVPPPPFTPWSEDWSGLAEDDLVQGSEGPIGPWVVQRNAGLDTTERWKKHSTPDMAWREGRTGAGWQSTYQWQEAVDRIHFPEYPDISVICRSTNAHSVSIRLYDKTDLPYPGVNDEVFPTTGFGAHYYLELYLNLSANATIRLKHSDGTTTTTQTEIQVAGAGFYDESNREFKFQFRDNSGTTQWRGYCPDYPTLDTDWQDFPAGMPSPPDCVLMIPVGATANKTMPLLGAVSVEQYSA